MAMALCAVLVVPLSGCTDSNGKTKPTPKPSATQADAAPGPTLPPGGDPNKINGMDGPQALGHVIAAVNEVGSFHSSGSYTTPMEGTGLSAPVPNGAATSTVAPAPSPTTVKEPVTVSIDSTGSASKYEATLIMGPNTIMVRGIGAEVFLKGNKRFADGMKISALQEKWVRFPASDARVRDIVHLAQPGQALITVLRATTPGIAYAVGAMAQEEGQELVQILLTEDNSFAGSVMVAAKGKPLPYKLTVTDPTGTASLRFDKWSVPPTAARPEAGETEDAPEHSDTAPTTTATPTTDGRSTPAPLVPTPATSAPTR